MKLPVTVLFEDSALGNKDGGEGNCLHGVDIGLVYRFSWKFEKGGNKQN